MISMAKNHMKDKIIWGKCSNCNAIVQNPFTWGLEGVRQVNYGCPSCDSKVDNIIIVKKGGKPPKWWQDSVLD